ncbi:hypothetical protein ACRTEC_07770 [Janibacter indicus]
MDDDLPFSDPEVHRAAQEDLAGVVRLLLEATRVGLRRARMDFDFPLGLLAQDAANTWSLASDRIGPDPHHICCRPMSPGRDFFSLICEAEQILARRPIEQWPGGTSELVAMVCDLIGASRLNGFDR